MWAHPHDQYSAFYLVHEFSRNTVSDGAWMACGRKLVAFFDPYFLAFFPAHPLKISTYLMGVYVLVAVRLR